MATGRPFFVPRFSRSIRQHKKMGRRDSGTLSVLLRPTVPLPFVRVRLVLHLRVVQTVARKDTLLELRVRLLPLK